ncbi:DNA polymerase IV [Paenibacillus solanacearum]|uniref:DNA polymerase IV n=1 Tax=Paenibacillus solanacearum TaxID=2048548 RepID=A0A916NS69_9BACL|nr:DNA polymerase IV [Paenibacillus solanacearum]CAG7652437.1 DNA polymerase IV [Paenibacillus solanacearum]
MRSKRQRVILLADCRSFYASVEKAAHPEYANKPLVVAGNPEERRGIILAACPLAKTYGVTTAESVKEALNKCPGLVIIKPRMQTYIDVSLQITEILEHYTDLVEPYSIDEQFADITDSVGLFGNPLDIAKSIQDQVYTYTGVYIRIGISENKVLSKMACDNIAKKNDSGLCCTTREELITQLWTLPVKSMFMIGSRMMAHFNRRNIHTIGDLAHTPLADLKRIMRQQMKRQSDIQAEVLWKIANGMDDEAAVDPSLNGVVQKAIGHQMTLPFDYWTMDDLRVILLELSDLVCRRARAKGRMGWVVAAGAQGADFNNPTGFYRQSKLSHATDITNHVYEAACRIFDNQWDGFPVRKVGVTLSSLVAGDHYQLTLFDNSERLRSMDRTTDSIRDRFGDTAIIRASSVLPAGQAKRRSNMIGGHWK